MAQFQTTVELKAVTGDLNRKLDKVNQKLKGVNTQVKKTQGVFKTFGNKVGGTFKKLNASIKEHRAQIAGIGLALGAVVAKGVADFKKFEDGMSQIATLGVKDLKKVEKELDNVRKQFGVTGAEATKGYYDIISAGAKEGEQALNQLTAAVKLAKAGNTDLTKAVDILTSGVNVWKDSNISALEVTDKLFLAVKYGKTTVAELGATFGRVAPLSAAAGASIDDYAASMAVLTAGGFKTEDATTGLKGAFGGMLKVTEGAKKAAEALNIEWKEAGTVWGTSAIQAEGFESVLVKLNTALTKQAKAQGLNVAQAKAYRAATITKLFEDKTAAASILTLTGNIGKFSDILGEMSKSAGTTQEALDKVKKSFSFNIGKFNQSLSIMSKSIGGSVVPVLIKWADAMAPVVDFMAALILEHPGIIKITVAVTALGVAFAFLGGPFTAILATAGYGIKKLLEHFGLFSEGGVAALEKMKLAWDNFWAGLSIHGVASSFDDMVSSFLGDQYFDLSDYFTLNGEELIAKIKGFITPITDYISSISWDGIWAGVETSIDWVISQFEWLYKVLVGSSIIPDLVNDINDWWDKFEFGGIKDKLNSVVTWFKEMYNSITAGGIRELATVFVTPFKAIGDSARTMGKTVGDAFDKALAKSPALNKTLGGLRNAFVAVKVDAQAMGVQTAGIAVAQLEHIAVTIKQKRELQKLVQAFREMNIAHVDDLENLKATATQRGLVMENASKYEQKIIQGRIDRYRTLGREIGETQKQITKLELEKLTRELGKDLKGRSFISRFMFGDGTLLTWEQKFQGLLGRLGKLFSTLGTKILTGVTKVQLLTTSSREAGKAVEEALAKQAAARSGLKGAKTGVAVSEAVIGVKDPSRAVSKESVETLKKLRATANKWNKALNLADTELRAAKEAFNKANASVLKIRSGSTGLQKAMLVVGRVLGETGSIFRLAVEQTGKVIPKIKTAFGWLGKASFALVNIGGILDGLKSSKALAVMQKFFKKVLIVFAVFDAYKGATDADRIVQILGKSKEDASNFELGISAISNAVGNFFSGFAHLAGTVIGALGGEHLAKYLESVDLAPQIAKIFKGIVSIFKAIGNILGNILTSEAGGESGFTKIIKLVGTILSWVVDFFVNTANALEILTSGKDGAWDLFASSFKGIFTGIISGITGALTGVGEWIGAKIKGIFDTVVSSVSNALNKISFGIIGTSNTPEEPGKVSTSGRSVNARSRGGRKDGGIVEGYANGGFVGGSSSSSDDLTDWLGGDYDARFNNVSSMDEAFSLSDLVGEVNDHDVFDEIQGMLGNISYDEALAMLMGNDYSPERVAARTINKALDDFSIGDAVENVDYAGIITPSMMDVLGEYVNDLGTNDILETFDSLKGLRLDDVNNHLYEIVNDLVNEYDEASMDFGYAAGGRVKGRGTSRSDSIPARLSNGEFVVNARAAAKHRGLLEKINGYANGGTVGDAKSYQFLQFQGEGEKAGSFDFEATMEKFVNHLDAANPAVVNVIEQLEFLRDKSSNLNEEKTLEHDYTRRINRALIKLNKEKKNEAEVTKDAAGGVKDLGDAAADTADKVKNEWKGMGKELTGPIKQAFLEGGSIGDGIKQGMHNLFKSISGKLLDRIMKPMEDSIDNFLNDMFGTESEGKGTTASPMITKDVNDTVVGGLLGGGEDGQTGGGLGDMMSGVTEWFSGIWDSITDWFDGIFGGSDEPAIDGLDGATAGDTATATAITTAGTTASTAITTSGTTLSTALSTASTTGSTALTTAGTTMSTSLTTVGTTMSTTLVTTGTTVATAITTAGSAAASAISAASASGGGGLGGGGGGGLGGIFSLFGSTGGMVTKRGIKPMSYFANGGFARGTDTVPAMLTPGEMVLTADQQKGMGAAPVNINQTVNITEAMDPQKFQQELVKNNKVVVGLVQQSYQKRGQMGPQGYGQ